MKTKKKGDLPEVKKAAHSITDFSIPNEKAHGKNQLSDSPMKKGSSLSEDQKKKISENKSYKKGGKFPDLNKDGKITKADILKGRGVFKKGGKTKSRVNEAANYTKPGMRKRLFERIKAGSKGGNPGQWSARKAQLLASEYKKKGGGYKN